MHFLSAATMMNKVRTMKNIVAVQNQQAQVKQALIFDENSEHFYTKKNKEIINDFFITLIIMSISTQETVITTYLVYISHWFSITFKKQVFGCCTQKHWMKMMAFRKQLYIQIFNVALKMGTEKTLHSNFLMWREKFG